MWKTAARYTEWYKKDGVYVHVINFTLLPLFFCFRRLYNKKWYEREGLQTMFVDELRDKIKGKGYVVKDTKKGMTIEKM